MQASLSFSARDAATLEIVLIALVLFCLPLFEAPKNVFSVIFLIVWIFYAIRSRCLGRAAPFDAPIAGLAAILWIAPVFSEFGETITALNSAPRWTLLALFVIAASRLDYSRGQFIIMLAALIVGGAAAVVESLWVWSLNDKPYPEFRSVGHVNHSSMYSLIPLAAGIGALLLKERWVRAIGLTGIISSLAFLLPSKSLVGGVTVTVILMLSSGVMAVRRWSFRGLVIALPAVLIVVAGALATPPAAGFRNELVSRLTGDDISSQRLNILNSALAVWDRHPLFGTGWFSFGTATAEGEVRRALAEDGIDYDPNVYAHFPHGHNLWTTTLIERGGLGLGLVSALLLIYFNTFWPLILIREQPDTTGRSAALAALLVVVGFTVAGLGNTTMMNEHGQAGMALIAIVYGHLRRGGTLPQG